MPLKHSQESRLVFLLGLCIALAGMAAGVLPALPKGTLPWVGVFLLFLLYPVMLAPMLRSNRADTAFRRLHWFPAGILLLWFALQFASLFYPAVSPFALWYSWGWALVIVALGFFLVVLFCLQVIRQRTLRIALLALVFVPFAAVALLTERSGIDIAARVTALLQNHQSLIASLPFVQDGDSSSIDEAIASSAGSSLEHANLDPSEDPSEERWRMSLRAFKERMDRVMHGEEDFVPAVGDSATSIPSIIAGTEPDVSIGSAETSPEHLPASGMGVEAFAVLMLAGYCATLQKRARARVS